MVRQRNFHLQTRCERKLISAGQSYSLFLRRFPESYFFCWCPRQDRSWTWTTRTIRTASTCPASTRSTTPPSRTPDTNGYACACTSRKCSPMAVSSRSRIGAGGGVTSTSASVRNSEAQNFCSNRAHAEKATQLLASGASFECFGGSEGLLDQLVQSSNLSFWLDTW